MKDDGMTIRVGGNEYNVNRDNIFLFTFAGDLAIYDHVFLVTKELDDHTEGTYIFKDVKGYQDLATFILDKEYPMHLFLRTAANCDVEAWERHVFSDVRNSESFPDEWQGES